MAKQYGLADSLASVQSEVAKASFWTGSHPRVFLVHSFAQVRGIYPGLEALFNTGGQEAYGLSFAHLGIGFVFVDEASEEYSGNSLETKLLNAYAHELAHLCAAGLLGYELHSSPSGTPEGLEILLGFSALSENKEDIRYGIFNEYWAEMTAITVLDNLGILSFDTTPVTAAYVGSPARLPAYAILGVLRSNKNLTTTELIVGALGEVDRKIGWPVYQHLREQVQAHRRFDPDALDNVIERHLDVSAHDAAAYQRVGKDIAALTTQLAHHHEGKKPSPYIERYMQTDWLSKLKG